MVTAALKRSSQRERRLSGRLPSLGVLRSQCPSRSLLLSEMLAERVVRQPALGRSSVAAAAAVKHRSQVYMLGLGAAATRQQQQHPCQQQMCQVEIPACMSGVLTTQVTGSQTAKTAVLGMQPHRQQQQQQQQQQLQQQQERLT